MESPQAHPPASRYPEPRVLVIAEDPLSRAGLAALLGQEPCIQVVAQVARLDDPAADIPLYQPDVLVWDLGWTPLANLEALQDVWEQGVPVLALVPDKDVAPAVWAAGVRGLLPRDAPAAGIAMAARAVGQGLAVLDPSYAASLGPAAPEPLAPPASLPGESLTPREMDVLRLLAEGLPNKSIARRLSISEHTVKFHINAVLAKLNVQSRTEAVIQATRLGLINL